eukprot:6656723-Prymnesium_polylepis.1
MGKINTAVKAMQVWIAEESAFTQSAGIIQDRLIFGATNLTPLLHLQGRFLFELSAACALVRGWQRAFDREAESAKIDQAEKERRAAKAARTRRALDAKCADGGASLPGDQGLPGAARRGRSYPAVQG